MAYTFYELAWLFFIYSFIGWCLEVCAAVLNKRKFINRGFVGGPLCPIYGTGAVIFAVFLPELKGNLFFLFLGGSILASVLEFLTGALLERIFHRKWWSYSNHRFNFDGYICLRYSLLWGLFAILLIYFGNPFFLSVVEFIPHIIGIIVMWVLSLLLLADFIGSAMALLGLLKKTQGISQLTEEIHNVSRLLENAITLHIQRRMEKAFPSIEPQELKKAAAGKTKPTVFAADCSFYKLISIFFLGAFLGDLTETIFCWITMGRLMSRSSVVYGPFSIVWGLGCMLLTAILYRIRNKGDSYVFIAGTLLGGAYEYVCSVFTELVFGTIFWDYSGFTFNLGGRINLLYCFFWGIAAVVWMKLIYPFLSRLIEKIPIKPGKIICNLMIIFMIFNCLISSLALSRYTKRNTEAGPTPATGIEKTLNDFLDSRFPDERMKRIYPNVKIVQK